LPNLYLDFETASELDLAEVGLDNYARHKSTRVLMLAWAIDDRKVQLWLPHQNAIPVELMDALNDPNTLLIAHNAQFERTIFHRVMGKWFDYSRWRDTMVLALSWSLPGKLDSICKALRMTPEDAKADGDALIHLFSMPARDEEEATLFGTIGRFNDWNTHPKEWKQFEEYCKQDVRAERALWRRLNASPLPENEWKGWFLDQKINDRGMPVNRTMAVNGLEMAIESNKEFMDALRAKTQLDNPNSTEQLKPWLAARGYPWQSLRKEYVEATLKNPDPTITKECREVLKLRQDAAKKSYTKIERLLQVLGPDDCLRYQFRFGGAARTLRWAGGDVQTQNLPRPTKEVKKNYQQAIDLIMERAYNKIKTIYPSVVGMVTGSLRMLFQAPPGQKMVVCDLNAIENRVLGFLSRCRGILEVFELHRDPYIAFCVMLYAMEYDVLMAEYKGGNEDRRQNAKPAVLGPGYGLGPGVKKNPDGTYEVIWKTNEFGDKVMTGLLGYAANMGINLTPEIAYTAWSVFRTSFPEVVQYWTDLEEAFKQVLKNGGSIRVGEVTWNKRFKKWEACESVVGGTVVEFDRRKMRDGGYMVRIHLPSGRCLHYLNATLEEETVPGNDGKPWNRSVIYYDGVEHSATQNEDGSTARRSNKWGRTKTYGGKLCENIVQAFSRDLLLNGMLLADDLGFDLFGMFHDELAALVPDDDYGLGIIDLRQCMMEPPSWAPTIPLGAEGFESKYYRK
jgi:DNA polymerase